MSNWVCFIPSKAGDVLMCVFTYIGKLEVSMALAYTQSANLRALSLKSGCPEALLNCQPFFESWSIPKFITHFIWICILP